MSSSKFPEGTEQSTMESPFFRLPIEVRNQIYGYAVRVDDAIEPHFVNKKSNKFFSPDLRMDLGKYRLLHKGPPFAATALIQTCRQIHRDLGRYPAFYRLNHFRFESGYQLHVFLAALTPQKRHSIRHISMYCDWFGLWYFDMENGPIKGQGANSHVTTLLRECRDLRDLDLNAGPADEDGAMHMMSYCDRIVNTPTNEPVIWNLPQFRFAMWLHHGATIDFTDPSPLLPSGIPKSFKRPREFIKGVTKAKSMFQKRKELFSQREKDHANAPPSEAYDEDNNFEQRQLTDSGEGQIHPALREALLAANIDFVGEERVAQGRFNDNIRHISSRTRGSCKPATSLGTIASYSWKYNSDGLLIANTFGLEDMKWAGADDIHCKVIIEQDHRGCLVPSWEALQALMTRQGLEEILVFYHKNVKKGDENPSGQLEKIKAIPPPEEILKRSDNLELLSGDTPNRTIASMRQRFHLHQSRYEKVVAALETKAPTDATKAAEPETDNQSVNYKEGWVEFIKRG